MEKIKTDRIKAFSFDKISTHQIQITGLVLIGILETIAMVFGFLSCNDYRAIFVRYINLIAMLYVGVTIRDPMSRNARNLLILGILFCAWPLLMQVRDFKFLLNPEHPRGRFTYSTMICEYLMLLSFAAVLDEKEKATGLKIFGWFYIFAALCFPVMYGLIQTGVIPESVANTLITQKSHRVNLVWHPNTSARIMMIAIGISLAYLCMTKKIWLKAMLVLFMAMDYVFLALTNSKSVMLITSCLPGAVLFFKLYKRDLKSFLAGLLAAGLSAALIFAGLSCIYRQHYEAYHNISISEASQVVEHAKEETQPVNPDAIVETSVPDVTVPEIDVAKAESILKTYEYRNSSEHLLNFGGRTDIWRSVFRGLAENPRYLLTGVRDTKEFLETYSPVYAPHAHNSWLQILLELGVIGFGFAIYITYLAIKNCFSLLFWKKSELYQKLICVLVLVIMVEELVEPFIFYNLYPENFVNMIFLFCVGYAIYWNKNAASLQKKVQVQQDIQNADR